MLYAVASFCPVCLTTMTEKTTFIINQDLRLLSTYHLNRPCSALKVLLSCSLKKWNCCSSPCAPLACDTDLKNPKPWSKLQHKIPSINPPWTAKSLLEKYAEDCIVPNLPEFLPQGPPARTGASRPVSLWDGCLLQPRPRGHDYGAVSVK